MYRGQCNSIVSKFHGREERNGGDSLGGVHRNEPIKCLLEYTITHISVLRENSIETAFGSVGLPTAIKETNESITNLSNFVAMEEHCGDARLFVKGNSSVSRLPVLVVRNGGVHLLFDLTHGRKKKWFVWYVASIGPQGSVAIGDGPVRPLSIVGRFQTLTHTITMLCLCPKGGDVGCHDLLANLILGSGVVHVEASAVNWFELVVCHVTIVGPVESVGQTKSASASGVTLSTDSFSYTRTHAIGSPVVRRQII